MAEIHVEAKKKTTPAWVWVIWVIVILVILGIIAYFIVKNNKAGQSNTVNKSNTTSYLDVKDTGVLYM